MFEAQTEKACCGCSQIKPEAAFNFKNRALGRLQPLCRECQHAWNREHYRKNKATYIATAKRHNREYGAANFVAIVDYLRSHPCVDCGEADILVLHFDHRDRADKSFAIGSRGVRFSSWSHLASEIAKCDVRCANCHMRRTAKQFGWRKLALQIAGAAGLEPATSDFGDRRSTS